MRWCANRGGCMGVLVSMHMHSVQILQLLVTGPEDGVMIPIPQYPLYSATLSLLNGTAVHYYPDEAKGWTLTKEELRRAVNNSPANVKAICIINPGNPTGQCLSADNIREILEFAREENIAVLADEVCHKY